MESFENKDVSFKKHTGKEKAYKVVEEVLFADGAFGKVFYTLVDTGQHKISGDRILKRFIVKKYSHSHSDAISDEDYEDRIKEDTKHAFQNYTFAKKAGLKVFPTFRMGEDEKSILMTTGFSDDKICVGTNSLLKTEDFEKPLIKNIANVDNFLDSFFKEGSKAAQRGIGFYFDNFFFMLSKEEPTKIDFVLGDFDNLQKWKGRDENKISEENMENIKHALEDFCQRNIDSSFREEFLSKVEFYFNKANSESNKL